MKQINKFISMLMASVVSLSTVLQYSGVSASAETDPNADFEQTGIVSDSNDTLGSILADQINEKQTIDNSGCTVYTAEIYGTEADVTLDTAKDGKVAVCVYSDPSNGQAQRLLGSGVLDVTAGMKNATVPVSIRELPTYYQIRVYLLDTNDAPISKEYINSMHTLEMEQLLASDINDYSEYEVLNLDDDITTNFAVYNQDVVVLHTDSASNIITKNDSENRIYEISNYTGPTDKGSIVSIEGTDGIVTTFKIVSVTTSDTVTTIQGDASLTGEEVFDFIKVDTDSSQDEISYTAPNEGDENYIPITQMTDEEAAQARPPKQYAPNGDAEKKNEYNANRSIHLQLGKGLEADESDFRSESGLEINAIVDLGLDYTISFYQSHVLRSLTLDMDADLDFTGEFNATLGTKIPLGTSVVFNPTQKITLYLGPYFTTSIAGKAELTSTFKFEVHSDSGITANGWVSNCQLSAEGFIGFGIGGGIIVCNHGIDLDLYGGIKVELEEADEHDGCETCYSGTISLECTGVAKAEVWIVDVSLEHSVGWNLGAFYVSDSMGFGWGECPNLDRVEDTSTGSETSADTGLDYLEVYDLPNSNAKGVRVMDYYRKYIRNIAIPSETDDGYPITEIGDFSECRRLEEVTMPDTIVSIASPGFSGCKSLLKVKFSNSLTTIGSEAFQSCSSLRFIVLPDTVKTIGDYAFNKCSSLQNINFPNSVTTIGDYAFHQCLSLQNVNLPNSLTRIGRSAFQACHSFDRINLPASLTEIGDFAFGACMSVTTVKFRAPMKHTLTSENGLGRSIFENCLSLESICLPNGWDEVSARMFYKCQSLTNICLSDSTKRIDSHAFNGCTSLKTINLPDSITYIGNSAFAGTSIAHFEFPPKVPTFWGDTFRDNETIQKIVLPKTICTISFLDGFGETPNLNSITILNRDAIYSVSSYDKKAIHDPSECSKKTFYGYSGTKTEKVCKEYGLNFVALDAKPSVTTPDIQPETETPQTLTFTDLEPNTVYNFYDILGDAVTTENLLYLSQGISDENGTLTVSYYPAQDDTDAKKFVKNYEAESSVTPSETTTTETTTTETTVVQDPVQMGDVNCDGSVTVSDAILACRMANEDITVDVNEIGKKNADCDGDGAVTSVDSSMILKFIAKLITEL